MTEGNMLVKISCDVKARVLLGNAKDGFLIHALHIAAAKIIAIAILPYVSWLWEGWQLGAWLCFFCFELLLAGCLAAGLFFSSSESSESSDPSLSEELSPKFRFLWNIQHFFDLFFPKCSLSITLSSHVTLCCGLGSNTRCSVGSWPVSVPVTLWDAEDAIE